MNFSQFFSPLSEGVLIPDMCQRSIVLEQANESNTNMDQCYVISEINCWNKMMSRRIELIIVSREMYYKPIVRIYIIPLTDRARQEQRWYYLNAAVSSNSISLKASRSMHSARRDDEACHIRLRFTHLSQVSCHHGPVTCECCR
jgi:hypothetical protein